MDRRGFLSVMLGAAMAPAVVKASSIMRIQPRDVLVYKTLNRYDLDVYTETFVVEEHSPLALRPTKLIVPRCQLELANSMINTKELLSAAILGKAFTNE